MPCVIAEAGRFVALLGLLGLLGLIGGCSAPPKSVELLGEATPEALRAARSSLIEASRSLAASNAELRAALERRAAPPSEEASVPADHPMASRRIAMRMQNARVGQLLWILASEYGISLAVDPAVLELTRTVSLHLQQVTGRQALEHILHAFDVHGHLGSDDVLVVSPFEERVFDLGLLVGRSHLELGSGGDVFGSGAKDGASGLKSSLTIKGELGDKGDGFDHLVKSIEAMLGLGAAAEGAPTGREKPRLAVNRGSGTLYVRATPSMVRAVATMIARESRFRQQQVQIDAQLIDVQLNDQSRFGIDWSLFGSRLMGQLGNDTMALGAATTTANASIIPGGRSVTIPAQTLGSTAGTGGGIGLRTNHFSLAINALRSFGAIRVLSNPNVLVRNGTPAYLSVGNSIRYIQKVTRTVNNVGTGSTTSMDVVTDSIFSGVVVGVSAVVKQDGLIELFIHPSQTQVSASSLALIDVGADNKVTLPVVSIKGLSTTLNIRDGDTAVIGGLIDQQNSGVTGGVPGLSDLPGVGRAFVNDDKSQNARELVVVLRARLL